MRVHLWAPAFAGFGGGITAFSQQLALGLSDLGHELRLFGKDDRSGSWSGHALSGSGRLDGPLKTAGFVTTTIAGVARDSPAHVISTHVNFGPAAQLARRLFGTPYSLVAHGIDIHPRLPARTVSALRGAEKILAVSEWTRDRVLGIGGIESARVSIVHNTIDETRFMVGPKPLQLQRKHAIRAGEKVLLTVARLDERERYKGYDRIVEALPAIQRDCGPVRFLIVGEGTDSERVAGLARDRGVASSVTFAGFVASEDIAAYYRLADAFAMPSTGEGFGIVFAEAMACGTPVIAGNRDGSVDALDAGRLGRLIDPMSVEAIASAVSDVLARRGPGLWFDPDALHDAVIARFGRDAFRAQLREALPF